MLIDYHIHSIGHAAREHNLENLIEYLRWAEKRNIKEVGFADHDRYLNVLNLNLYEKLQTLFPKIKIRVGLEIDYFPKKIEEIIKLKNSFPFDYVIGSVHYIDEWMFDNDKYVDKYKEWDMDRLYEEYLKRVVGSAKTGLFPLIGHMDLIKIFNFRPNKSIKDTFLPSLKELKKTGVVVELNTNGWHKPVKELYPCEEIIKMCFETDIPITLSSDAHQADQVGRDVDKALEIAKNCGYRKLATFSNKRVKLVNV